MSISPDKLREQMEQTITTMLPTISEELKSRIKLELKKQFESGLEEEKTAVEESLKTLSTKETETLDKIKKELVDIKKELNVEKADALKVITKNIGELADSLKLDPKFKEIILALPLMKDSLFAAINDAKAEISELNRLRKEKTKDGHAITIQATNVILAVVITSITVISIIIGLIFQIVQLVG